MFICRCIAFNVVDKKIINKDLLNLKNKNSPKCIKLMEYYTRHVDDLMHKKHQYCNRTDLSDRLKRLTKPCADGNVFFTIHDVCLYLEEELSVLKDVSGYRVCTIEIGRTKDMTVNWNSEQFHSKKWF